MMKRTTKVLEDVVEGDRCRRFEVAGAEVDDEVLEELQ